MRVLVFCPDWELLAHKCSDIVTRLEQLRLRVEKRDMPSLNDLRLVKVEDGLVQLPQIIVLQNEDPVLIITREDLEKMSTDDIVAKIVKVLERVS